MGCSSVISLDGEVMEVNQAHHFSFSRAHFDWSMCDILFVLPDCSMKWITFYLDNKPALLLECHYYRRCWVLYVKIIFIS